MVLILEIVQLSVLRRYETLLGLEGSGDRVVTSFYVFHINEKNLFNWKDPFLTDLLLLVFF